MTRLTPLVVAGNAVFYFIMAAAYCRILKRRFSWPVTLFGFLIGFLAYILPTQFMPYADFERTLFGLVTFPMVPIVLFRDNMVCLPALRCRRIGIHVGVGSFFSLCFADTGAAPAGSDLPAVSSTTGRICHLFDNGRISDVDIHPADEPL